jgi:hypothetical protein
MTQLLSDGLAQLHAGGVNTGGGVVGAPLAVRARRNRETRIAQQHYYLVQGHAHHLSIRSVCNCPRDRFHQGPFAFGRRSNGVYRRPGKGGVSGCWRRIVREPSTTGAAGVRSILRTIGTIFARDDVSKVHRDHDDDQQRA